MVNHHLTARFLSRLHPQKTRLASRPIPLPAKHYGALRGRPAGRWLQEMQIFTSQLLRPFSLAHWAQMSLKPPRRPFTGCCNAPSLTSGSLPIWPRKRTNGRDHF